MNAMSESRVLEYLARIGAARTASLRDLQLRHLLTVPFDNLAIHQGERIVLDEEALVAKVVDRRRGGFCYELNGAFAALLSGLGHEVELLAARSIGEHGLGIPYDHLALRVGPWLVDVGFGSFSHFPLRLDERGVQADPSGTFHISDTPEGDLDVVKNGVPEYRLELRPRRLNDFEAGCWWHRTSPSSHFTRSLVCSRLTDDGRVTLSGRTLTSTVGGVSHKRDLGDDGEVLAAYREYFGIELDRVPQVTSPRAGESYQKTR
jgi:N-hydroxyarylamine O-acetyltransferase